MTAGRHEDTPSTRGRHSRGVEDTDTDNDIDNDNDNDNDNDIDTGRVPPCDR